MWKTLSALSTLRGWSPVGLAGALLATLLVAGGCLRDVAEAPPDTDNPPTAPVEVKDGVEPSANVQAADAAESDRPTAPGDDDLVAPAADPPPDAEPAPATAAVAVETEDARYSPEKYTKADVPNLAKRIAGDDWPSFLGPTRDSKSTETGIFTKWPADGPRVVWQRSLGTSYGIGSVSRGRYFQFDRHGDRARLTCLQAETGDALWHWEYPTDYRDIIGYNNGPRCSPVVDDDRVYIFGAEGMLHCLRVTDGQLFWQIDTHKEFGVVQNFFGVGSTPVIEGDLLICMIGGSPASSHELAPGRLDLVENDGTCIVAFDKFTGEVVYKSGDDLASYAVPQLATIDSRRWGFMFARGGLIGFEPAKGTVDFHYPWRAEILESVNAATPVVVGDEVLISETYGPGSSLLKVSPGKAEVVWKDDDDRREKAMQTHWNTPVYHDGHLYGSSGRHEGNAELRCIEWKTGKVMWSQEGLTRASLLYVDGHFVCLGEDGVLRLLTVNPRKYDVVATAMLEDKDSPPDRFTGRRRQLLQPPCWAAPILSHGLLYVRGDDRVVCLELIP